MSTNWVFFCRTFKSVGKLACVCKLTSFDNVVDSDGFIVDLLSCSIYNMVRSSLYVKFRINNSLRIQLGFAILKQRRIIMSSKLNIKNQMFLCSSKIISSNKTCICKVHSDHSRASIEKSSKRLQCVTQSCTNAKVLIQYLGWYVGHEQLESLYCSKGDTRFYET